MKIKQPNWWDPYKVMPFVREVMSSLEYLGFMIDMSN